MSVTELMRAAPSAPTKSRLRQIALAALTDVGYPRLAHAHDIVINKGFLNSGLDREPFDRLESVFLIAQALMWTAEDGVDIDYWHDWAIARLGHLDVPVPPPESAEEGQGEADA